MASLFLLNLSLTLADSVITASSSVSSRHTHTCPQTFVLLVKILGVVWQPRSALVLASIWVPVCVVDVPLLTQLPTFGLGGAAEDGPSTWGLEPTRETRPEAPWPWPGPVLAIMAIWGVSQQVGHSLCLFCLSLFFPSSPFLLCNSDFENQWIKL